MTTTTKKLCDITENASIPSSLDVADAVTARTLTTTGLVTASGLVIGETAGATEDVELTDGTLSFVKGVFVGFTPA